MKRLLRWLDCNFEPVAVCVLFLAMIILVAGQVILRFVFKSGFAWAEEFARFMFVWLVYLSLSYATRQNRHIRLTILSNALPETGRKVFAMASDIIFFLFSIILLVYCIGLVKSTAQYGDMAVTLNVSRNVLYVAGVVGFLMNCIRLVQNIVWKIAKWNADSATFSLYHSDVAEKLALGVLEPMYEAVKPKIQPGSEGEK